MSKKSFLWVVFGGAIALALAGVVGLRVLKGDSQPILMALSGLGFVAAVVVIVIRVSRPGHIPQKEGHNDAVRTLAERYNLELHEAGYDHRVIGRIPNFSFATGHYRGFGIFAGVIYLATREGFSVLEVSFESVPGTAPLVMKKIPPKVKVGQVAHDSFLKYFRGPTVDILSPTAQARLLELGREASMLVIEDRQLRVVPAQPIRFPRTPPPAILQNFESMQAWVERMCDLAEHLGARKIPEVGGRPSKQTPSYAEITGREYPMAKSGKGLIVVVIVVAYLLFALWLELRVR